MESNIPTVAQIQENPSLLTHSANAAASLRSCDGKVGALVHAGNRDVIVTSPNSDSIFVPPLGERAVRMKEGIHFADDDPMYYPQPFLPEVGFLSAIPRSRGIVDSMHMAFYHPGDADFVLKDPTRPWVGLGLLEPSVSRRLKNMFDDLHVPFRKSVTTNHPNDVDIRIRNDERLNLLDISLQRLMQRLSLPCVRQECFMLLSLIQRTYLEFHAAYNWVVKYAGRANRRVYPHEVENLVGAFTDDLDVADALFYAGIPVWVVHPVENCLKLRIDRVCEPLRATTSKLPIYADSFLDMADADPPYRVIFKGKSTDLARYKAMSIFLKSLTSTGILSLPVSASLKPAPGRSSRKPKAKKKPYAKSGTMQTMRNKFVELTSPLMPESIPAWRDALASLSRVQEETPDGVNAGYALPDPGLFLQPQNDTTKAFYFSTWIKVREILMHRISTPQTTLEPLSNRIWRSLLALEKAPVKPDSQEGQVRARVLEILRDCCTRAQININFNDLSSVPALWNGIEVSVGQLPPAHVARQILWELYETNFRLEFLAVDTLLSKSDQPREERQIIIDSHCWSNGIVLPDLDLASKGLNAKNIQDRAEQLRGLHLVMTSWSGSRPSALHEPFPVIDDSQSCLAKLAEVEKEMAQFYVEAFFRIFGRAAMVPHFLQHC